MLSSSISKYKLCLILLIKSFCIILACIWELWSIVFLVFRRFCYHVSLLLSCLLGSLFGLVVGFRGLVLHVFKRFCCHVSFLLSSLFGLVVGFRGLVLHVFKRFCCHVSFLLSCLLGSLSFIIVVLIYILLFSINHPFQSFVCILNYSVYSITYFQILIFLILDSWLFLIIFNWFIIKIIISWLNICIAQMFLLTLWIIISSLLSIIFL